MGRLGSDAVVVGSGKRRGDLERTRVTTVDR